MISRFAATFFVIACVASAGAQDVSTFTVAGPGGKTLSVGAADLRKLEPTSIKATDPHSKETATYLVVPLSKVLGLVDTPFGENLKGPMLAATVRVEARDKYRVAFSLVELDSRSAGTEAFVAFEREGNPLAAEVGPFRLIVPTDRRGARWVRQLSKIAVITE